MDAPENLLDILGIGFFFYGRGVLFKNAWPDTLQEIGAPSFHGPEQATGMGAGQAKSNHLDAPAAFRTFPSFS